MARLARTLRVYRAEVADTLAPWRPRRRAWFWVCSRCEVFGTSIDASEANDRAVHHDAWNHNPNGWPE